MHLLSSETNLSQLATSFPPQPKHWEPSHEVQLAPYLAVHCHSEGEGGKGAHHETLPPPQAAQRVRCALHHTLAKMRLRSRFNLS